MNRNQSTQHKMNTIDQRNDALKKARQQYQSDELNVNDFYRALENEILVPGSIVSLHRKSDVEPFATAEIIRYNRFPYITFLDHLLGYQEFNVIQDLGGDSLDVRIIGINK